MPSQESLYPFESRYRDVAGCRVHYIDEGSGPALLLLHGNPTSSFLTRDPDHVRALVIGNTWAWPVNGDPHFERFSRFMGGPVGGFLIRRFNFFVNVLLPAGVRRRRLPGPAMEAYREPFRDPGSRAPVHVLPGEILKSRAFLQEVERGLPRLADRPALIVWGDRDFAFREAERKRFEGHFPRHRSLTLRGAGHYIQEDAPDEIVAAIERWWDQERLESVLPSWTAARRIG